MIFWLQYIDIVSLIYVFIKLIGQLQNQMWNLTVKMNIV